MVHRLRTPPSIIYNLEDAALEHRLQICGAELMLMG